MSNEFDMDGMLSNLEDTYQSTEAAGLGVDPGEYIFWVKNAEICKAQKSNRIQVKMEVVVVNECKFVNMPHYSYDLRFTDRDGNADERAIGYFKLACNNLGITPAASIKDAPETVAQMVDRVFDGAIVKNGEFLNLRIRRLVHPNYLKWIEEGARIPSDAKTTKKGSDW